MKAGTQKLRIIVTGLIAQHPRLGGVTWDYAQYVIGLAQLDHDVFYIEDTGEWPRLIRCDDPDSDWIQRDPTEHVDRLRGIMAKYGLQDRWGYRFGVTGEWFGLSEKMRLEIIRSADLLINVSGTLQSVEPYAAIPVRAYIDSDPAFTQIKRWSGKLPQIEAHNVRFSFGEKLHCSRLKSDEEWIPTRQPIVCDLWHRAPHTADGSVSSAFTTVMNWSSYEPLLWDGEIYGQKDVEFLRFLKLPSRAPTPPLEVAMLETERWVSPVEQLPEDLQAIAMAARGSPRTLLRAHGWHVMDAAERCGTPESYHDYIRHSRGEWSVAKNGYVRSNCGWFSGRSACYLAAGRPVVVQSTGFEDVIPTGIGLMTFKTLDDAAAALHAVEAEYERHSKAACEIAHAYFDHAAVLTQFIERAFAVGDAGSRMRALTIL